MKNKFNVQGFVSSAVAMFKSGNINDAEKFKAFFEQVSPEFVGSSYKSTLNKVIKESEKNEQLTTDESLPFQSLLISAIDKFFKGDISYTSDFNPKNHITHKFMKTSDFINLADYPANRDVTQRMKKEHMKTLNSYEQTKVVIVEITPDNAMYWNKVKSEPVKGVKTMKLDGHSRAYAWTHKQLEVPEMLSVTVYKGLNDEQINRCYDALTSPLTAATASEQIYTLKKRTDFEPKTKFVGSNWKTAFSNNAMAFNEHTFAEYTKPLSILDGWLVADFANHKDKECVQPKGMNSAGIKTAIIEQIKRDGDVSQFWNEALTGTLEARNQIAEVSDLLECAAITGNGGAEVRKLADAALRICDQWETRTMEENTAH
ncbi:hypothetical protein IOU64_004433 [Salmonella enterica]|nr:hypothetical protein [Salmonella enterica]